MSLVVQRADLSLDLIPLQRAVSPERKLGGGQRAASFSRSCCRSGQAMVATCSISR